MLLSLLLPRPILFYIVRSIQAQGDPQRFASFNADWSIPQFRSFYRLMTIVWGAVTVAHLLLMTLLVFTLPISLMLAIGPIMNFAVMGSQHFFVPFSPLSLARRENEPEHSR